MKSIVDNEKHKAKEIALCLTLFLTYSKMTEKKYTFI